MEKVSTIKKIDHPLEELLNIESGSTEMVAFERVPDETVQTIEYDDKDTQLEEELTEIQREALETFDALRDQMDSTTDNRQKARLAEVANQLLSTSLDAVKQKLKTKAEKDKLAKQKVTQAPSKVITNNTVIMDRNEALRQALAGNLIIDGDE